MRRKTCQKNTTRSGKFLSFGLLLTALVAFVLFFPPGILMGQVNQMDKDGDGKYSKEELKDSQFGTFFDKVDINKNGFIEIDELMGAMMYMQEQGQSGDQQQAQAVEPSSEQKKPAAGYSKYVTKVPILPGPLHGPWIDLQGYNYENAKVRYVHRYLTKPNKMLTEDHNHSEFDEFLIFFGSDAKDISKFDAEIEIYIGKGQDRERFVITEPTVLFLPKGLSHGPLEFKKVNKPVTMVILATTPRYDVPHMGH